MKEENEKKSTITFGEMVEIMQRRQDQLRLEQGLSPKKVEPFISEEPKTRVTMKSGISKHSKEKEREEIIWLFLGPILLLGFIFVQFRVYKLFIN